MSTTHRSSDSLAAFADLETRLFHSPRCSERRVVAFIRDVRSNADERPANVRAFLPRPPVRSASPDETYEAVLLRAA